MIRNEYQYEKTLVDERIKSWSKSRLRQEGFALFDLKPTPRGALFQDKVSIVFLTRKHYPFPPPILPAQRWSLSCRIILNSDFDCSSIGVSV